MFALGLQRLIELPPGVGEATRVGEALGPDYGVVAVIAISLQEAPEACEEPDRDLGPAARIVVEQDHRLSGGSIPLHPEVGFGLRGLPRFLQHLDRALVHLEEIVGEQPVPQQIDQGLKEGPGLDHPGRQRGPRQIDPDPGQDLLLTVQRQRILVFRDRDVGEEPRGGHALRNGLRRQRCGPDALPTGTGIPGALVLEHLDLCRDEIELLARDDADLGQPLPIVRTDPLGLGQGMDDEAPGQCLRQGLTAGNPAGVGGDQGDRGPGPGHLRRCLGSRGVRLRLIKQPDPIRGHLTARCVAPCECEIQLLLQAGGMRREPLVLGGEFRVLEGLFGELRLQGSDLRNSSGGRWFHAPDYSRAAP